MRNRSVLPDQGDVSAQLTFIANHLNRIQCLVQKKADCMQLLHELMVAKQALSSIQEDLIRCNVEHSLSILLTCQEGELQKKELEKLIELFIVT